MDPADFERDIAGIAQPVVLRGQVGDWPAVRAAGRGDAELAAYLSRFDTGRPAEVMIGPPAIRGRFFYREAMDGFNFRREPVTLSRLVEELLRLAPLPDPPSLYAGAAMADDHLPGWAAENAIGLPLGEVQARVWVGNATHVSTHYDVSSNLACVVAGRRAFTLFPPEQLVNLYVGPLDRTVAGQPLSMVDIEAPDLDRYPRFAEAMAHGVTAELAPGDAIVIPSLWWHNVRATTPFNVLVNYWSVADPTESPFMAFAHALLSIRDLPLAERKAWRAWFEHYVFAEDAGDAASHLPEHARGVLAAPGPARNQQIKQYLISGLTRR
ncbi:cupin-like domain-containing protein [Sphingomonas gilva]|uniref:Cupin-like domain-containing protein n=1 Tax=Sphingomonas gilva TaxID=2305907 RepID=A0A396RPV7_9SPHN|nr:cupin-like domain-containing protein [Sphingomonas gilva]